MGQGSALVVRFALMDDIDVVSRYNYIANVAGADKVRHMIGARQVVVAERSEHPLGYAYFDYLGVLNPFLAMIWVFEEHRTQGVGRAILRFLEDHFRELGHGVLYSSSSATDSGAQAWHRRMGFEECGVIVGLGKEGVGEVYFRKRLR